MITATTEKAFICLCHDTDKAARAASLQFFFYQFISGDRFFRIAQLENLYKMFVTFLVFGKRNTHVFFLSFLNFVIGPIDMSRRLNGAGSTHKARFN